MMTKKPKAEGGAERGDFFYVDLHQFYRACALGPDQAAAYLIIAAGSDRNNILSTWSAKAVAERTGITRPRARKTIDALIAAGLLVKTLDKGMVSRPRYTFLLPQPSDELGILVDAVRDGRDADADVASRLWRAFDDGHIEYERDDSGYRWFVPDRRPIAWLPNSLVEGEAGGASPVEKLRLTRDPMTMRLLVDLYANHDLPEHGGVHRQWLRRLADRELLSKRGGYAVWRFTQSGLWSNWGRCTDVHRSEQTEGEGVNRDPGKNLWRRVEQLEEAGALEWVFCLAEDADVESQLMMPVCLVRRGQMDWDAPESRVGLSALYLLEAFEDEPSTDHLHRRADRFPGIISLPAPVLAQEVQLVGIPRLRYRPKTTRTVRWLADWGAQADRQKAKYLALVGRLAPELLRPRALSA